MVMMQFLAKTIAVITRRFHPRGTQRVLRLLFNPSRVSVKGTVTYGDGLRILVDTSSFVEWEIFFRGQYEKKVTDLFQKFIRKGDVVIDVGANIGSHTLIMAKLVGESGKVIAFEPHPDIARRLTDNIKLNRFTNVSVSRFALSEKPGKASLFSYSDGMLDKGTSSLYGITNLEEKYSVDVSTLDVVAENERLSRLDFVKVDTRGSDFPVIKGARESIGKFHPYVVFEYNQDNWRHSDSRWEDAWNFFEKHGYSLHLITEKGPQRISGEPVLRTSHNILAIPKNRQ